LPPNKITIGAIVRILEGDIAPVPCLSTTNYVKCEECHDEATCGIRLTMADVDLALSTVLDGLTLADMIDRSEAARTKIQNVVDYNI
jgi:DNA-binding IscR family transcriptional regulator